MFMLIGAHLDSNASERSSDLVSIRSMKLTSLVSGDSVLPAVARDGGWHVLPGGSLEDLIRSGTLADAVDAAQPSPLTDPVLAAPLRPGKVVAIGLNYMDHVREAGIDAPTQPLIFAKFPSSVIGPNEAIEIDTSLTRRVDWEVELAVVIGKRLSRAQPDEVLDAVLGYTVANDVSARDLQFGDGQWVRGKSLDTFCPLGPVIVTPDDLGDPQSLRLATRVNGRTMQNSNTSEMLFSIVDILVHCSNAFTLEPGDVILTGTPWGCGEFMDPKVSLSAGDIVECEVEGIGVLKNTVRHRG